MNEKNHHNLPSENSEENLLKEAAVSTDHSFEHEEFERVEQDVSQTSSRSTYETFFWLISYIKMFTYRLAKDLFITLLGYVYSGPILPNHILDLMNAQNSPESKYEPPTVTCSSSRTQQDRTLQFSLNKFLNAFKSYVLCSEDDTRLQCGPTRDFPFHYVDKDPMFIIVDSSCLSNPSSKEILIHQKPETGDTILKKYFNKNILPIGVPSTSKGLRNYISLSKLRESESTEELQMIDINLQSDNDIQIDDIDNESIVISYLKKKEFFIDFEGTILSIKKKSSLLESVPKMETIVEGEQFSTFPTNKYQTQLGTEDKSEEEDERDRSELNMSNNKNKQLSESSLDAHIPSYPGSPRSLHCGSDVSLESLDDTDPRLKQAVNFLHQDTEFLMAAEIGDDKMLEILLSKEVNRHQIDLLGRNALHLAVCCNNERAVLLLLKAGVNPNLKDNLGMTPLSICLMRRPSLSVVKLLFNYGAEILPRSCPMDTGLFLQFVMMCTPTEEEEKILRYLVDKGATITDLEAPGGRQALHFAAMSNNCRLINILMDLGADLFVTNHRNETPKEVAITFRCKEAMALLEKLETDYIQSINESSCTSL